MSFTQVSRLPVLTHMYPWKWERKCSGSYSRVTKTKFTNCGTLFWTTLHSVHPLPNLDERVCANKEADPLSCCKKIIHLVSGSYLQQRHFFHASDTPQTFLFHPQGGQCIGQRRLVLNRRYHILPKEGRGAASFVHRKP